MISKEDSNKLYEAAIERWGKPSQIEMLIEEMAELTLALQKFKRDPSPEKAKEVCDEMADVEIMLEQNRLVFNSQEVDDRKQFKLDRLTTTLKDTMYKKYQMDEDKLEKAAE